jgi:hypothetical protein
MKIITTSWDDGHPLDFKIAELLDKYNLSGTFYIPQHNGSQQMMPEAQMQELAKQFEIGGHTLNHVWLNNANHSQWEKEIKGSYHWLQQLLGKSPVSFCFPGGVYNPASLSAVFSYGYQLARSTELLSTNEPSTGHLMPTSLQVYEHTNLTYAKHLAKRGRWKKLANKLLVSPATDLVKLTETYLNKIETEGHGCFHLWGHSWEMEEFGLWKKLEDIFKVLSARKNFSFRSNSQLLQPSV